VQVEIARWRKLIQKTIDDMVDGTYAYRFVTSYMYCNGLQASLQIELPVWSC